MGTTQTSMLLPIFMFDTLKLMRDTKAERQDWKYWTYFTTASRAMLPHIKNKKRLQMQSDYVELQKIVEEIKNSNLHPASQKQQTDEARFIYADARESIIYDALPNIGLGPDQEEGVIDFKKINIEELAKLVQSREGKTLENAGKVRIGTEDKDAKDKEEEENGND